jgi:hypothetical protein
VHCCFGYCYSTRRGSIQSGSIFLLEMLLKSSASNSLLTSGAWCGNHMMLPFCGACPDALLFWLLLFYQEW